MSFTLGGEISMFLCFVFCLLLFKEDICRMELNPSLLSLKLKLFVTTLDDF